ncbi:MAG: DUF5362 domain-containing protein [candidate division Zixibacteria bacterium]|nr:DUF5362 domain-containing protein [candidate division Zixibacteria bacterium]
MEEKELVQQLSLPIYEAKGWMKLLGVVLILNGVVAIFTIVGILICWLPIWLGILLFKSASLVEAAQISGDKMVLLESLRKIKTYFTINGILMLIVLAVVGLSVLMAGGAMFAMLDQF